MRKLKIALVFISLFLVRYFSALDRELPPGTRVRLTIPTIDFPEYTDSQTIIKRGKWEVRTPGYTEVMPGEVVVVEGVMERGRVRGDVISNHKFSNSPIGN